MHASQILDSIAKAAAVASKDDLPALVHLNELLVQFAECEGCREHAGARDAALGAGKAIESVILREAKDDDAVIKKVYAIIDELQVFVDSLESGEARDIAPPSDDEAPSVDPDLYNAWIEASNAGLNEIEASFLRLESDRDDEAVADVRRRLHTIKGECGVVSAHGLQELYHEAESAIDRVMASDAPLPTDTLLAMVDWTRSALQGQPGDVIAVRPEPSLLECIRNIAADGVSAPPASTPDPSTSDPGAAPNGIAPPTDTPEPQSAPEPTPHDDGAPPLAAPASPTPPAEVRGSAAAPPTAPSDGVVQVNAEMDDTVREFIAESREHLSESEQALLELESRPDDTELINTVFRAFHTIKGVAGFLNLEPIVAMAHKSEFLLDAARNHTVTVCPAFLDIVLCSCDQLSALIGSIEGGTPPPRSAYNDQIARLDAALNGDIQAPATPRQPEPGTSDPIVPAPTDTPAPAPEAARSKQRHVDQTIKVNTMRLDSLVDMVGELVIGHQMVVQDPSVQGLTEQRTQRNLTQVGKIIRDLQEVAMSLRMVTLRGPFQKMTRLVRDLASKSGKKIRLTVEGEDTELDRNIVDEIGDPLVHMIRNACDHGLEPPEERVKAGKPAEGSLTLRAFHKGGSIVIEVEDDGRGLYRDKLLRKAAERGILPPDREPEEMSDNEVFQLIFAPGFSTAEKITDVSGRGVGMDVVRRNIEALRGKVEIRSTPGKGSTFVLSLPLTMAIIDGMVVRVGSQRYVIPTLSIEQSFRPRPEEIHTVMSEGEMVKVRGALLPIYRLSNLFELDEGLHDLAETLLVVIEANNSRCCLQVDELLGQQQVVIKSLGKGIGRMRGVSGGAILGDGRVAPILDVAGLFAQATENRQPTLAASA